MTPTEEQGYLESDYLEYPYGSGQGQEPGGMQILQVIRKSKEAGHQTSQFVKERPSEYGAQVNQRIGASANEGLQILQIAGAQKEAGMQAAMKIVARSRESGMQVEQVLAFSANDGMQVSQAIADEAIYGMQAFQDVTHVQESGMQASQFVENKRFPKGMEVRHDVLRHAILGRYLVEAYLTDSYLSDLMGAFQGMQVNMINKVEDPTGVQVSQVIEDEATYGMQLLMEIVDRLTEVGMQATQIRTETYGMQATMVIYNKTQLRLMYQFPSRGTVALGGNNWTANSTAAGDFSANNLNTDIIEQRFQSASGSASLVTLVCDTGLSQGVPVDTIAIYGHNLTKSAQVQVQGSKDNFATPPDITFNMVVELNNMFYIAPTFPNLDGQNRQWKFVIQDPTNPEDCIKIGMIVFGASEIFSIKDSFQNPIEKGFRHFKDVIETEGFTNAENDRALRKYLKLRFKDLTYAHGNFRKLEEYYLFCRTSLKALVIPTPEYPSRFAVYAKLSQMPDPEHISNGETDEYVTLDLDWDESK